MVHFFRKGETRTLFEEAQDMNVKSFFDGETHTLTYLVWDPATLDAVV